MRTRAAVAVIILLAITLTGCGKSKKSSASSSGSTTSTAPAAVTTMDITAKEYTFDGPNSVAEGYVKVNLNDVGKEDHQAQFLRLQDGKTLQDFAAAAQGDPTGLKALALTDGGGGVNVIKAGSSETGVNKLRAGNWVMVCFVPAPDGIPHIAKGMVRPFVVTPPPSSAAAPTSTASVSAKNFSFTIPTLKSGKQTVEFKNTSTDQVHEMTLVKLAAGKTYADAQAWIAKPAGQPPFESAGGAPGIGPGDTAWADVDFTPGTYIALCHVPDPKTGKEHAALGMVQQFTVT
ncbi:MAG: hypothetical protein JOZ37_11460 [Actinobacteria bacterium]|nr:hypothetical protein [Actinomycetota bacterium]MBV9664576.1 hypothetical protein [Actinomycetota bacterium]MBV9935163.1 hypothetical protein [Actinomycetota bacterium]